MNREENLKQQPQNWQLSEDRTMIGGKLKRFSEKYIIYTGEQQMSLLTWVTENVGKTNSSPFRNHDPGELVFKGMTTERIVTAGIWIVELFFVVNDVILADEFDLRIKEETEFNMLNKIIERENKKIDLNIKIIL